MDGKMYAEIIHPLDLAELLNQKTASDVVDVIQQSDGSLLEIDGKLYVQSVRFPAKTTKII